MAFKFPWTNIHEINLDWIVNFCIEAKDKIEEFAEAVENGIKNPYKLKIRVNERTTEYDGSEEVNIDLDVPTLPLPLTSGGTGKTTRPDAAAALGAVSYADDFMLSEEAKARARNNIGAQSVGNLVTEFSETPSDNKYPSEKLVADNVAELGEDIQENAIAINEISTELEPFLEPRSAANLIHGNVPLNKHDVPPYNYALNNGEAKTFIIPNGSRLLFFILSGTAKKGAFILLYSSNAGYVTTTTFGGQDIIIAESSEINSYTITANTNANIFIYALNGKTDFFESNQI